MFLVSHGERFGNAISIRLHCMDTHWEGTAPATSPEGLSSQPTVRLVSVTEGLRGRGALKTVTVVTRGVYR